MNKKTLIIIPGWDGTKESWKEFTDIASNDFDVQVIELPCFGNEPCPDKVWGIGEYADFVKSKIKDQRSENEGVVILGHSFGGQVAVKLIAENPDICEKLVLSGPAIFREKKSLKVKSFLVVAKIGKKVLGLPVLNKYEKLAKKVLYRAADSPDYMKTSGTERKIFQKVIRQDVSNLLAKIKVPTMIVWGSEDNFVPLTNGQKAVKMIPEAKLKIFQGGRHGLHKQQPEELLTAVREFTSK